MFIFRTDNIVGENHARQYLRDILHPEGLSCPNSHYLPDQQAPNERKQDPLAYGRVSKTSQSHEL